jgi:hypothetical protein
MEPVGGGRSRLHGELTIRDATRSVVLEVEHGGEAIDPWGNRRVAFSARTSLDRRDFGLTWNQVLEAGGVLVGERIDVELEVQGAGGVNAWGRAAASCCAPSPPAPRRSSRSPARAVVRWRPE